MLLGLVLGVAFIATGLYLRPRPRAGEVLTTGRVVESYRGHAYGEPAVLSVVEFLDETGRPHLFRPEVSGPRLDVVGDAAAVTYLRSDPQGTARRTDGTARWYWLLPVVLGSWSIIMAWLGLMS